ncbi:MAG TPA: thioredoxin domain-containing protein [Gammaproteobacteria bacterium]|nr:thioredoxin domain-containing protein [Gammaproteobacteria bacterium]
MCADVLRSCITLLVAFLLLGADARAPATPPPAGGWRLVEESSPYLRLHADNPVEWHTWGAAAFEKARRENRPLFISIGYFTCHWCHVMARESFSDPAIAALLNAHFIAIKVDREQRPDVDAAYMRYVTLTSGQGGWPLSVWATPDGKPFQGGTYYPPEAGLGRPGFRPLLEKLAAAWARDADGIRKVADTAVASLRRLEASATPLARLDMQPVETARERYAASYDELQGGFGVAPRFPQPARLLFLLQGDDADSAAMALHTLDSMLAGGIHDQLGGGFHRYAIDPGWHVPHFEKMLYDQALIARACLAAYRRTGAARYAVCVRSTLDFALDGMRAPQGGFYSALGADSPVPGKPGEQMQEGAYYTWRWAQLAAALPDAALRDWAVARYGITRAGETQGEVAGSNVLYRALDPDALAARFGVEPAVARQRLARIDAMLLAVRRERPAVPIDDKVVTAWNGYMITTLALAGRVLDEPRYLAAAVAAAEFLGTRLLDAETGILYRDWRDGVRGVPGFCEDYAALAEALLALYRVSGEPLWLQQARTLTDAMLARFRDARQGGFFNTGTDTELWLREKPLVDGAAVSANGVALQVLLQLATLTGDSRYRQLARETAAWAAAQLEDAPDAMPYTLAAWALLAGEDGVTD